MGRAGFDAVLGWKLAEFALRAATENTEIETDWAWRLREHCRHARLRGHDEENPYVSFIFEGDARVTLKDETGGVRDSAPLRGAPSGRQEQRSS